MDTLLSPYILLRKAGLPYRHLADARPSATWSAIGQLLSLERQIEQIAQQLDPLLYDQIPQIKEDKPRNQLLNFRRKLKKGKAITSSPEFLLSVKLLQPNTQKLVFELMEAQDSAGAIREDMEQSLRQEMDENTRKQMQLVLENDDFVHALSLNNQRLFHKVKHLDDFNWGKTSSNKSERTLFSYLSRAAAKTSPLSTFMSNMLASYEPQSDSCQWDAETVKTLIHTDLNRGVVARIQRFCQQDLSWFNDIELELNSSVEWQEQTVSLIASVHIELLGRPWRQQQSLRARIPQQVANILQQLSGSFSWLSLRASIQALGVNQGDADTMIKNLLNNDVISRVCLWQEADGNPLDTLRDALNTRGTPKARPLITLLDTLAEQINSFADAPPQQLAGMKDDIEKLIDKINCLIGARFVEPYNSSVSETVWQQGKQVQLGKGMQRLAKQVAKGIAERIQMHPEHAAVLSLFIQQYGAGGRCTNLLSFLRANVEAFAKHCQNPQEITLPCTQQSIGVTVYGQLLCQSLEDLDKGKGKMVLNLLYERLGWQAARYLPHGNKIQGMAEKMRDWLQRVSQSGEEPVEIALSSECNNLQSHQYITDRVVSWPGEPVPGRQKIKAREYPGATRS